MKKVAIDGDDYILIPDVDSVEPLTSKAFTVAREKHANTEGFLVREEEDALFAYTNSCPHTGAPLNWTPDQFLTTSRRYIQCSVHGAMFKMNDGECFSGPCIGKFLKPLRVKEQGGKFYLAYSEVKKSPSV
ncbi:MAG: ferredoxin [Cycloclasticus sp. symbiont of Poecilosclerida sp. M]|nr:MAG: ferredoxin [Cycloclasticus sp. symbiont of Poecilosclerida sp. M]